MSDAAPTLPRGLYALVDASSARGRDHEEIADALLRAGARVLQLRWKAASEDDVRHLATRLVPRCEAVGALLIVNDHVEVAARVGAAGVHLGQDDGDIVSARRILGPRRWIGRSTHELAQVVEAVQEGASYLGFGPVFDGGGKVLGPGDGRAVMPSRGVPALAAAVAAAGAVPVVAIGGITLETLPEVRAAGAWAWAPMRALVGAEDITHRCASWIEASRA